MNAELKNSIRRGRRHEALETFLWVAFVTVILWVWADLEQTRNEIVSIPLVVNVPPGSDLLIQSPPPTGLKVHFTCVGAQGRLEQFLRELTERAASGDPIQCVTTIDPTWEPGEHYLNVADILNNWDMLSDAGLSAESPAPERLSVVVDRWVETTATVMLRTANNAALAERTLDPAEVRIRAAQRDYEQMSKPLTVYTEMIDLASLPVGQEVARRVPLVGGIEGHTVEFLDSPQVNVKLRIERRTVTRTLTLPVQLLCSPELLDRVNLEGSVFRRSDATPDGEWTLEVTVSGERKDIERLASDPAAAGALAYVQVGPSDFEKTEIFPDRPVQVLLPPGLELIAPTNPKVHFKFNTPAAAPAPAVP